MSSPTVKVRRFLPVLAVLSLLLTALPLRAQLPSDNAVPAADAPGELGLGPVTATTLPNGLKVLVAPSDAAKLITLDVWMGAGTRRETAANNGAAHFMEHLIFKGTPTRRPGEIDAQMEDLGGSLNAATSYDWAHFYVTVGASDADKALAILSDAVQNASLRQEDIDAERPVIISEQLRELSSPVGRITRLYNATAFPDHPYGRPLTGTEASVGHMTRATILKFYQTYYAPGNATVILAGKITPETGLALARKYFGAWPARPVPANTTLPERQASGPVSLPTVYTSVGRSTLMLGFHAPSVKDQPAAWVMDVLLTWLGQGGNNKLAQELQRHQKVVSSITANYLTQRDPGTLSITAECNQGSEEQVREAILGFVARLRETPLSAQEVSDAKHSLLASYLFDTQTNSGRANALGFYSVIDTYQYDTDYVRNVSSVTPEEIQAAAVKYLDPNRSIMVRLSPRIDPQLASHLSSRTARSRF